MLTNLYKKFSCTTIVASCLLAAPANVQAQISVQPAPPLETETTRHKPVSRGSTAPFLPPKLRDSAAVAESGGRDLEFAQLQREAEALDRQFSFVRRIVRFASPSIVHIEATKQAESGNGFSSGKIEEAGAGIVVEFGGGYYVLTNRHVIHPAELRAIRIELSNGRLLSASRVWTDPSTDVAVLQLSSNQNLTPARLGDSGRMEVGDFVVAVGSPFGLSHSVTYGIISAKGRRNLELGSRDIEIQDFFQTDAAINPGNSGGPLINLRGEVVGINTAIASNSGGNEGIGFSIPINMAVTVAEQLVSRGKLARSYLGVQLENAFDIFTARRLGLKSTDGALVKVVIPNSPAEKCGLREGDVIVDFNGIAIENDGHLVKQVGLTPVGSRVTMIVFRQGTAYRFEPVLEPNPGR